MFYPSKGMHPAPLKSHTAMFCKMQQLMLMMWLEMRSAALQGCPRQGQQFLELWGKGGPGFGGGASQRAELNLALGQEAFSLARMPAPTTEAEYHLPNHSSHGRQGLAGLAKFCLNLGAQGMGEIQVHFSKDKKPLSILQITALQFPEGFSVITQITRQHVFYNRG